MTNTVLVSVDKTQTIVQHESQAVVTESKQPQVIVTGIMGPAGARTFAEMSDMDLSDLSDGGVLVYNQTNQKWTSTTLLNKQTVDCGQF